MATRGARTTDASDRLVNGLREARGVSWFSGAFPEFVAQCRQAFQAGQRSKHR
jgi:hypothetical protein